jgi:thioredoxin-like negative regulator of GroEL
LESGRKTAALSEFVRIFKENPENREARTHLIDAYLGSDRIPDAEELLAQAIGADSTDVDAHVQRAQIWLLRGNADAAEKDLNVALEYRRESAEAHYLMAQVHRNRQNEQLQVVELTEALRLNPGYSAARLELSRSLIGRNPQKALDALDAAPEDQRQNSDLRVQRIWPLLELNRFEEARAAIGLLRSPENSEVLLQDAVLHMRQRNFTTGRELAQKALVANQADVRAHELIMRCAGGE